LEKPILDEFRHQMSLAYRHGQRSGLLPRTQEANPLIFVRPAAAAAIFLQRAGGVALSRFPLLLPPSESAPATGARLGAQAAQQPALSADASVANIRDAKLYEFRGFSQVRPLSRP